MNIATLDEQPRTKDVGIMTDSELSNSLTLEEHKNFKEELRPLTQPDKPTTTEEGLNNISKELSRDVAIIQSKRESFIRKGFEVISNHWRLLIAYSAPLILSLLPILFPGPVCSLIEG